MLKLRRVLASTTHILGLISKPLLQRATTMLRNNSDRMVWVDLEMTGLDIEKDHIIEMAVIVTDGNLEILAEMDQPIVIHQPDAVLDAMNDWCQSHHGKSGLTEAVRRSTVTIEEAEEKALNFIREVIPPGKCPLAGNSVHEDRRFLMKEMPKFVDHLHYRIIDVSSIKELSKRWFPKEYFKVPQKKLSHRALDDIKDSINELRYYRENIFKNKE